MQSTREPTVFKCEAIYVWRVYCLGSVSALEEQGLKYLQLDKRAAAVPASAISAAAFTATAITTTAIIAKAYYRSSYSRCSYDKRLHLCM